MAGLFTPLNAKGHLLPNRIVMPPMGTNMATERGEVTDWHVDHYAQRAAAGTGMVIVEHSYIRPDGRVSIRQLGIHDDALVPGLQRLTDAVRDEGAAVGIQITHAGGKAPSQLVGGQPIAPSDTRVPGTEELSRAATRSDMSEILDAFGAAALRAERAGFDFVEIHGAHGYLLSQFLSPLSNTRSDQYGGEVAGRARFPAEVVQAVRDAVGEDYLILYRLGGNDYTPGGLTLKEGVQAAVGLAGAGVDLLDISGGVGGAEPPGWDGVSQGYFVPMAAEIRAAAQVPVVVAGGITEPQFADRVIREGTVDLVAIGRAMLSNPNWATDARQALLR